MKKLVIIAGHTGAGKTEIAYDLAKKLNGEIVMVDSIQSYKHLNIIANKPNKIFQNSIKYHNLSTDELFVPKKNALDTVERIREYISDIWQRNKIPILEGGCGLYFNILLTGLRKKMNDKEKETYDSNYKIAEELIKLDKRDFDACLSRLMTLDKSFPRHALNRNDFYRLQNRLTEALTFGDGAYKLLNEREEQMRNNDTFLQDTNVYNFFLIENKLKMLRSLEYRTDSMLETGLIDEVMDLIRNHLNEDHFLNKQSFVFLNAYGLLECIKYFGELIKYLDEKHKLLNSINLFNQKKDYSNSNNINYIPFLLLKNIHKEIVEKTRHYATRQTLWFKKKNNFVWLEMDNRESLVNTILNEYLNMNREQFQSIALSRKNQNFKNLDRVGFDKNVKIKSILCNDKNFVKGITSKSFEFCEANKEKITKICSIIEKIGKHDTYEE